MSTLETKSQSFTNLLTTLSYESLLAELSLESKTATWSESLANSIKSAFDPEINGNLPRWNEAFEALPELKTNSVDFENDHVTATGSVSDELQTSVQKHLMELHPWRKGPFDLFGVKIDTEWRSNLKWDRIVPHVCLDGKSVLDVGCGNGYYGWRMLGMGARRVIGLDPFIHYVVQSAAIRKYLGNLPNYVIPASDAVIPRELFAFDTVFSMGVLYHRTSPIDHLLSLANALKKQGELVLETLVIDGDNDRVLVPAGRYAKMRNVWFLPTTGLLKTWLTRCGFIDVQVVDVTKTRLDEQRSTDWMRFESLKDFLDPDDHRLTIEGYPAPTRAILIAKRK